MGPSRQRERERVPVDSGTEERRGAGGAGARPGCDRKEKEKGERSWAARARPERGNWAAGGRMGWRQTEGVLIRFFFYSFISKLFQNSLKQF